MPGWWGRSPRPRVDGDVSYFQFTTRSGCGRRRRLLDELSLSAWMWPGIGGDAGPQGVFCEQNLGRMLSRTNPSFRITTDTRVVRLRIAVRRTWEGMTTDPPAVARPSRAGFAPSARRSGRRTCDARSSRRPLPGTRRPPTPPNTDPAPGRGLPDRDREQTPSTAWRNFRTHVRLRANLAALPSSEGPCLWHELGCANLSTWCGLAREAPARTFLSGCQRSSFNWYLGR